jgi:two-component system, chemotaxis family, CheB/CheR fusion protein
VLESLTVSEKEVEGESGEHYLRRILPYRTEDNRIGGCVITFIDITQQKKALQATEQARRYAENIVDTIGYPLLVLDADLRVCSANISFYDSFQLTPEAVTGRPLHQIGAGEWDIPEIREALARRDDAERNPLADCEVEREFSAIGTRVLSLNARRVQRTDLTLLAIDDRTERKKLEEGEKLLLMELEHRVKNILQNVHALLRDARNRSKTVPELYEALASRIDALARTQEMLANCGQRQIELRALISQEAMAHAADVGQNLFLDGPPLHLMPKAAQVLAMGIHELATNAFKFGALSKPDGRVMVSWRIENSEKPVIAFQWKETGLEIKDKPPETGFGTEFIVKGLPFMLGGRAALDFEPDGVLCAVTFPAKGNVQPTQ